MLISGIEPTALFTGTVARPLQIVRVGLALTSPGPGTGPVTVRVEGPGVTTPQPPRVPALTPGARHDVEVPVAVAAPHRPGSTLRATVIAEGAGIRAEQDAEITVAEAGWTVWMVSHFHYDPVWWGTQGQFTQTRLLLPGEDGELPAVRTAFELVRLHLEAARADPDYKFVLAEIDYLKPYFDVHPQDRDDLRALMAQGRIEIVGGNYNEPNTNLTSAESTIRNAIHGIGQQRDVLGGDPRSAWMLDAFGFDPGYPGLMAAAGLTSSAWARGPYHQWGPRRTVGDNLRMQFPSEFEWISPDGAGLLTSYMPNHYGAGWGLHQAADLDAARAEVLAQLASLAPVAATRNVLLPVGADHVIPARWATAVHRDFRDRYLWPRCVTALPREFFAAVRAEATGRGIWLTPQTRDMNPVYPGKDVSYIDTKQAQRSAETAVSDGERLATLAWLAGAEYPAASLDKAWRQLVFGAHHDAITGTESDQVYLDLLGGWREAFERGDAARWQALAYLSGITDTRPPPGVTASARDGAGRDGPGEDGAGEDGAGEERTGEERTGEERTGGGIRPVVVANTLSWPRSAMATIQLDLGRPGLDRLGPGQPGETWLALRDETGGKIPFLASGVASHPDGTLATVTLTFRASMPALGQRTYWVTPAPGPAHGSGPGWSPLPGSAIGNEAFEVEADPARGGALTRILDRRTGTELLTGPGNELLLQEEYDYHPRWGEGQWLLSPKGPGTGSADGPAAVRAERCAAGSRLVATFRLGGLRVTQETLLWDGADRVEFRTHVDGSIGQDRLLRVRFPVHVPGGLPVYQAATAVVGRPFGTADADVAEHPFTLDNPAHEWFGLGSTARVRTGEREHAIGVAEVILPRPPAPDRRSPPARETQPPAGEAAAGPGHTDMNGMPEDWRLAVRDLVAALAARGVTATCSGPDGPRYGALDLDSNLPDCRIAVGGPWCNPWTARLAASLGGPGLGGGVAWVQAARPRTAVFGPGADVRGDRDLPVLVLDGPDLAAAIRAVTADLADAVIEAVAAEGAALEAESPRTGAPETRAPERTADPALAGHSVALLNRGTPGSLVTPDGALHISLMRASSAWPSGVWIDGEKRTTPDGASFAWQHWSHTFEYALVAGAGDWRQAGFAVAGEEYNHDLLASETSPHEGPLPWQVSLAGVTTPPAARPSALLSALKPRGNPLASGEPGRPPRDAGVTARLRDAGGGSRPGPSRLRLFTGITSARLSGLREQADGAALPVVDGEAVVEVPPAGIVTVVAATAPGPARPQPAVPEPAVPEPAVPEPAVPEPAVPEPSQPVFTRYWLHGKGPAPAGNLPVAVHLSPDRVTLAAPPAPAGAPALRLTVAAGPVPASGQILLDVPPALAVERADGGTGPLRYDLDAGGYASFGLRVRGRPDTRAGRYFVAAAIRDDLGQMLEDAVLVTVGEQPPRLDLPLPELLPLLEADQRATAAEIEAALTPSALDLVPGQRAQVTVRLTNRTGGPVRGECQLISPLGTWSLIGPWTRGFAVAPGGTTSLAYPVRLRPDARPGATWWALAKVMYFGRVRYSECARLSVCG